MSKEKQIDIIIDLLTEFDEMGFIPTTTVPDPEAYAIKWREKITKAIEDYRKHSEPFSQTRENGCEYCKKQIEEMAVDIDEAIDNNMTWHDIDGITNIDSEGMAKELMTKGYRKQIEAEWETIPDYSNSLITYRHICSECKAFYKDIIRHGHKYCHECGAKMKGDSE